MKRPKTVIQEILLNLIENGEVSIMDFPYLSGYRTRVSDLVLKHGLELKKIRKTKVNKYNNPYSYVVSILPKNQKAKAINLYNELFNRD